MGSWLLHIFGPNTVKLLSLLVVSFDLTKISLGLILASVLGVNKFFIWFGLFMVLKISSTSVLNLLTSIVDLLLSSKAFYNRFRYHLRLFYSNVYWFALLFLLKSMSENVILQSRQNFFKLSIGYIYCISKIITKLLMPDMVNHKNKSFRNILKMIEPNIDHCGTPERRISHMLQVISQPAFSCSKLTIETQEQGVKYVQN